MAGGQERVLRRRIRSVESTKKITRAMELIAASRIVRAQQAIAAARPYVAKMGEVVAHLADTPDAAGHPLFREVESRPAGGHHRHHRRPGPGRRLQHRRSSGRPSACMRQHQAAGRDVQLVIVGRKGDNYFRYRNQPILASVTGVSDRPSYEDARRVVAAIMEPFEAAELDQIDLVYTRFVSLGSQVVTERQLVPMPGRRPGRAQAGQPAARPPASAAHPGREAGPARGARDGRAGTQDRLRVRARTGRDPRPAPAAVAGVGDPGRHAGGRGLRARGPPAGHEGRYRQRRRADQDPPPGHEPGPPGRHHHRDHGDRRRVRGAAPRRPG